MKAFVAILGITLFFSGVKAFEGFYTPESAPSDVAEDSSNDEVQGSIDLAEQDETPEQSMSGPQPEGLTCADMGWYTDKDACDCDCGHGCVKKQWCGTGFCQPWPYYCWKCS